MPALRHRRLIGFLALVLAAVGASCDAGGSADQAGDHCFKESCAEGLVCHRYKCMASADIAAYDVAEDERQRLQAEQRLIAARDKESRLLRESGRKVAIAVEEPVAVDASKTTGKAAMATPESIGAGAIRVVHTAGLAPIFAACRDDERLVSGGCSIKNSDAAITYSYPSHFSEHDTLGARWNCHGDASIVKKDMEAYALCARLGAARAGGDAGQ